jgi:hypothetical protein
VRELGRLGCTVVFGCDALDWAVARERKEKRPARHGGLLLAWLKREKEYCWEEKGLNNLKRTQALEFKL